MQGRVGGGQALEQADQHDQLGAEVVEVAPGLVLVLQRAPEPEQRHRRRVRVDLDRPACAAGARVHVEAEARGDPGTAGLLGELRLARVGRVGAGVEPREVLVQRGLRGPVAGRVGDDQRRVDRDQAVALDVRRQRLGDLVVAPHGRHVHQTAVVVQHGQPGGLAVTPREVDSDEVHGQSLPHRRSGRASGSTVSPRGRDSHRVSSPQPAHGQEDGMDMSSHSRAGG